MCLVQCWQFLLRVLIPRKLRFVTVRDISTVVAIPGFLIRGRDVHLTYTWGSS